MTPFQRNRKTTPALFWLGVYLLPCFANAAALDLTGTVRLDNLATVAGAIVTLTDAQGASESAYTDMQGKWHLRTDALKAPVHLRVRAGAAYADATPALPESGNAVDVVLRKLTNDKEISDRLTASAHASAVRWKSAGTKQDFIAQCHFCHQIGNAWTRKPKTEQEWHDTIKRMEGYGALITWQNETDFANTLSANFNGTPVKTVQTVAMHPDLPKAKMREWTFGGPFNYVHDVEL